MPPTTRLQSKIEATPSGTKSASLDSKSERTKLKPRRSFELSPVIVKIVAIAMAVAILFMLSVTYFTLNGTISFAGRNARLPENATYSDKLEFMIKYQVPMVTFMITLIFYVISKRVTSPAYDPLSGYEYITQAARNILTNTMETYLMLFITQLIALAYLTGGQTLRIIPMINLFYIIGRISFWIGYPNYRTFGFMVSFAPTVTLNLWNLYKFGSYLSGLY